MVGQYEILKCPFCDKGEISCLFFPSSYSVHHVRSGKGRSNIPQKSSETWIIQSGCSFCGKTREEVEKELKNKGII